MRACLMVVILVVLVGCKPNSDTPCRAPERFDINLAGTELSWWPFKSHDTLYYFTGTDTLRMVSGEMQIGFDATAYPNNPECADDSLGYESRSILYLDSIHGFQLTTSIHLLDSEVRLAPAGIAHSFTFSKLFAGDYISYDSLSYFGTTYYGVLLSVSTLNDSVYYSTSKGIIRYKGSTQTMTLLP